MMKRELLLSLCLLMMAIPVVVANDVVVITAVYADSLVFELSRADELRYDLPILFPVEHLSDTYGLEYDMFGLVEMILVNVTVEVTDMLNVTWGALEPSNETIRVNVSGGENSSLMQVNESSTWDFNQPISPVGIGIGGDNDIAKWIDFSWSQRWDESPYESIRIFVEITACWNHIWAFTGHECGVVVPDFGIQPILWDPSPDELRFMVLASVLAVCLALTYKTVRPDPEPSESE